MTDRRAAQRRSGVLICAFAVAVMASSAGWPAGNAAREGMVARQDLEIVECLLPGQVRQLGNTTYITQRRPTRTTTSDCRVRGGEYVAYDRADYKSALRIWMPAAEGGDAEAQTNVGEIFERGIGGAPNPEAAAVWYQKAADQGYSRALFDLGTLYEQGAGVPQDRMKALNLYRQAWGVPADSLMFRSAATREQEQLREELNKQLAEKDEQLELLRTQVEELEKRPPPPKSDPAAAKAAADAAKQIQALKGLISRLQSERSASAGQLAALPAPSRDAGIVVPAMDPQAQVRSARGLEFGRYYALVIGNQNYQLLESLKTPRTDVERAAKVLKEKYGFTVQLMEDASDVAMLKALNDLNKVLKPNDNVLIYYGGHGSRMKAPQAETGYWLPVNAERPPDDTFWVPNEQITAHIGRLPARRVLVIADSCYAGLLSADPSLNIFGTELQISLDYVKYKLPKRSRLLLAAGDDRPIPDSDGQGDSMFARAFLDVLGSNNGILSAPGLFVQLQKALKAAEARNHGGEVPELKAIKAAGHELGDFFFVPRG
jgi:hypothetical protein